MGRPLNNLVVPSKAGTYPEIQHGNRGVDSRFRGSDGGEDSFPRTSHAFRHTQRFGLSAFFSSFPRKREPTFVHSTTTGA